MGNLGNQRRSCLECKSSLDVYTLVSAVCLERTERDNEDAWTCSLPGFHTPVREGTLRVKGGLPEVTPSVSNGTRTKTQDNLTLKSVSFHLNPALEAQGKREKWARTVSSKIWAHPLTWINFYSGNGNTRRPHLLDLINPYCPPFTIRILHICAEWQSSPFPQVHFLYVGILNSVFLHALYGELLHAHNYTKLRLTKLPHLISAI